MHAVTESTPSRGGGENSSETQKRLLAYCELDEALPGRVSPNALPGRVSPKATSPQRGKRVTEIVESKRKKEEDLEAWLLSSMLLHEEEGYPEDSSERNKIHWHGPRQLEGQRQSSSLSHQQCHPITEDGRDAKQAQEGGGQGEEDKGEDATESAAAAAVARLRAYKGRIQELEAKLVETEVLLSSDAGTVICGLEVGV